MEDDGHDVVNEINVYLCTKLAESLYIFQYPTRPTNQPYDANDVIGARVKPNQQKVEIDLALDRKFSRMKGHGSEENTKRDKNILTSTKVLPSGGCYTVGVLHKGNLYITPVACVVQMRQSMEYLDKNDAEVAKENPEEKTEEPEAQAVTVKFAGPKTERIKKLREKSFHYLEEKKQNEPWIKSVFHPEGSHSSKAEMEKLVCTRTSSEVLSVPMTVKNRLHSVVPVSLSKSEDSAAYSIESVSDLHTLPPADRMKSLFLNAYVMRFDQILNMIEEDATNLVRNLQQVAILVQGCWVVKSDVLYNNVSCSALTGTSSDILMRSRDYILWMFTKSRFVSRADILSVLKVPDDDISELLTQISKKAHHKGWEFKYPFDNDFVDCYPTVVQRQEMLWEVRYKQLVRDLRLGQMASGDLTPKRSFPPPPSPRERRHFKYRESISDDTEESGAESTCSDKMDLEYSGMKKGRGTKRTSSPRKRSASGSSKNQPRFNHQPVSVSDISPKFLSVLPSLEIKTELLTHVRDVLYEKFCLTSRDVSDSLKDTSLTCILRRDDCDSLLEETLLEVGAVKLKNKWPQNAPPVPLYAFTKFGSTIDRYRNKLLELFTNTARSRPNFLLKKIEDELGEIVSEGVCKQVFEEYCIYKSGYYYLKGTICPDTQ